MIISLLFLQLLTQGGNHGSVSNYFQSKTTILSQEKWKGGAHLVGLICFEDGEIRIIFVAPIEKDIEDEKKPNPRASAFCENNMLHTVLSLSKEALISLCQLLEEWSVNS